MNPVVKLLPFLFAKKKSWAVVLVLLYGGYQYISSGNPLGGFNMTDVQALWAEPRDILVDRVEDARDVQQDTSEEFKSALEKFKSVVHFDGGDLEKKFNTLSDAFERSEKAAKKIDSRVDKVVDASNTLLEEWKEELKDYNDPALRDKAALQFDRTREQASRLIAAMRKAQDKTEPVLAAFRDQVLFLKHNLNMQAITALTEETNTIETNVADLIRDMEDSIAEANAFINAMGSV